MGNHALSTNAGVFRHADLEITTHGSDWYFTVCSVMGFSTLCVMAHAFTKPQPQRFFHYITSILLFVAAIAYFSMGSNLGQVPVRAEFMRPGDGEVFAAGTREIFYARYIDWVITTPLLLVDLLVTAGVPWPTIIVTILADEIMIVCGLIGALVQTTYKWGYWTFGMIAFFYVVYVLLVHGRKGANAFGGAVKTTYYTCGVVLVVVWFLYPIAWGVGEGGNVIHPDSEAIYYGILDLIAKPVFSFILLRGHRNIDMNTLGVYVPAVGAAAAMGESKKHHHHHHNGHHNTAAGTVQQPQAAYTSGANTGVGPQSTAATHTSAA